MSEPTRPTREQLLREIAALREAIALAFGYLGSDSNSSARSVLGEALKRKLP